MMIYLPVTVHAKLFYMPQTTAIRVNHINLK